MIKNIGCLQFEVQFGQRDANIARVEQLLSANTKTVDLLVLPELCFSGYDFVDKEEVASLAEPAGSGTTFEFVSALSKRLNTVVVAGYAEDGKSGRYYNSSMLVTPDGQFANYRKIHLFSRENDLFLPGNEPPAVVETAAGRIGMMICFDWFFPETARLLALAGAQIIAHPSNLVLPYCQRAMYARSVENRVFSITANRIGTEDRAGRSLTFTGASQIMAPNGDTLACADIAEEVLISTEADISSADNKQLNPYNNLLSSRRTELYTSLLSTRGQQ